MDSLNSSRGEFYPQVIRPRLRVSAPRVPDNSRGPQVGRLGKTGRTSRLQKSRTRCWFAISLAHPHLPVVVRERER